MSQPIRYLSVCSGMEAASVAWHHLGWKPVAFSEIEPFPSAILKHHFTQPNYPYDVPNLGSLTEFNTWPLAAGDVDLLVGGTPCQSFSVAGKRGGLNDPRGQLMFSFLELAAKLNPRYVLWENVPGCLSSGQPKGSDFGSFIQGLVERGYGVAWRILDAQHFGVPQRRKRLFCCAVRDPVTGIGDWKAAAEILSLAEGLSGYLAKGKQTRKGSSSNAKGGAGADGSILWNGGDQANAERVVDKAGTLTCDKGQRGGYICPIVEQDNKVIGTLDTDCGVSKLSHQSVVSGHVIPTSQNVCATGPITHPLTASPGATEDGTGRGTPIVIDRAAFNQGENAQYEPHIEESEVMDTIVARGPHAVGIPTSHWEGSEVHPTLNQSTKGSGSPGYSNQELFSQQGGGLVPAMMFKIRGGSPVETGEQGGTPGKGAGKGFLGSEEKAFTIATAPDQWLAQPTAFSFDSLASNSMKSSNPNSGCREVDVSKTIDTTNPSPNKNQGGIAIVQAIPIQDGREMEKNQNGMGVVNAGFMIREDSKNDTFHAKPVDVSLCVTALQPSPQSQHAQNFIVQSCSDVSPTISSGAPFSKTGNERVECEAFIVQASELRLRGQMTEIDICPTLTAGAKQGDTAPLAVHAICSDVAGTLTVGHHSCAGHQHRMGDHSFLVGQPVAFQPGNLMRKAGSDPSTETFPTLTKDSGDQSPHVAHPVVPLDGMNLLSRLGPCGDEHSIQNFTPGDPSFTLKKGGSQHGVLTPMAVRRLTPVECERLQGFPDNWSRISWKGKPAEECPDGPRYKCAGNSMAVPVMRWIGEAIARYEAKRTQV